MAQVVSKVSGLLMNLVNVVDLIVDEGPFQEVPVLLSQGKHFFYNP